MNFDSQDFVVMFPKNKTLKNHLQKLQIRVLSMEIFVKKATF